MATDGASLTTVESPRSKCLTQIGQDGQNDKENMVASSQLISPRHRAQLSWCDVKERYQEMPLDKFRSGSQSSHIYTYIYFGA